MELVELLLTLTAYLPDFVVDNWETLGVIAVAVTVIAGAVARLTPTEKDDKIVGHISRFVSFVTKLPVRRRK